MRLASVVFALFMVFSFSGCAAATLDSLVGQVPLETAEPEQVESELSPAAQEVIQAIHERLPQGFELEGSVFDEKYMTYVREVGPINVETYNSKNPEELLVLTLNAREILIPEMAVTPEINPDGTPNFDVGDNKYNWVRIIDDPDYDSIIKSSDFEYGKSGQMWVFGVSNDSKVEGIIVGDALKNNADAYLDPLIQRYDHVAPGSIFLVGYSGEKTNQKLVDELYPTAKPDSGLQRYITTYEGNRIAGVHSLSRHTHAIKIGDDREWTERYDDLSVRWALVLGYAGEIAGESSTAGFYIDNTGIVNPMTAFNKRKGVNEERFEMIEDKTDWLRAVLTEGSFSQN
jgi:hypothetical protein